jgi:epoxyqueuosine reductase
MGVSEDRLTADLVRRLARECGFELAGIASAVPLAEAAWYREWVGLGYAGEMHYLAGDRADVRSDPRRLLPTAKSILCLGKLYNGPEPYSTAFAEPGRAWISRYAWGQDYHRVLRKALKRLVARLRETCTRPFDWKACVDTAPLLERAYARRAGLGWIGKNSCLINQGMGSWFFLAELLVSLEIEPDRPPPDSCGSCIRCVDACPTGAIIPTGRQEGPGYTVDSNRCVSYLTIELRGDIPAGLQPGLGRHVFGCDICQDVCPWNRKAPVTNEPAFRAVHFAPPLDALEGLDRDNFRRLFGGTAIVRTGPGGLQRNVAVALGNQGRKLE